MGNSFSQTVGFSGTSTPTPATNGRTWRRGQTLSRHQQQQQHSELDSQAYKSKSLPTRRVSDNVNKHPNYQKDSEAATPPPPNGETSRVLFLLYLIHRTWNVVVDTVDTKSKRSRRSGPSSVENSTTTRSATQKPYSANSGVVRNYHVADDDDSLAEHHYHVRDKLQQRLGNCSLNITDLDDVDTTSFCCSQYTACTCSYCYNRVQNVYNSIVDEDEDDCSLDSICPRTISRCESDFSAFYHQHHQGYQMAPSVCQNSPKLTPHQHNNNNNNATAALMPKSAAAGGNTATMTSNISAATTMTSINGVQIDNKQIGNNNTISITQKSNCGSANGAGQNAGGVSINGSMASYKMTCSETSWPQAVFSKENQRPPVYNPEDYVQALKKFGKRQSGANPRSIYDANDLTQVEENYRCATLPHKHSEYKSPIPSPPESDSEMSLRQFASVTDLLTKLRADLRVSFPSFVQEFVGTPSDGISLLLEVLRAIQLSQAVNAPKPLAQMTNTMPRNPQTYQRRALLDELACLQCLSICCSRSIEATARLGTTPVGLMPLASSATGQGIRARILALQLMTGACDKHVFGHGSQKIVTAGHTAVSEAMSTLRLRCSEPVRFRLLIGMLNSGGGSGELQSVGVRFINAFLDSAENLQQRLYLQAELFQAGFEPNNMAKTISASSPWLDALRNELKRFNELYVDVDKMITQAREAERVRSQMVILERRVQILHEEKTVLTAMERRLQERCADLQREIFRLQGAQHPQNSFKSLDKQPVALPRHVPPNKQDSSEHEDEGISSSETGPSLSPVPILVLPQKGHNKKHNKTTKNNEQADDDDATTIEDVIGELDHIVSEAEKQISNSEEAREQEIVPVNIVPQPPRKTRSLAHLVQQGDGSELDGSEYGMLVLQNQAEQNVERVAALQTFFDETDYNVQETDKAYGYEAPDPHEVNASTTALNASTTRELLDVIMNARHSEDDPTMKALRNSSINAHAMVHKRHSYADPPPIPKKPQAPAQQFNGVFFMTGMNTPQRYPKPDVTAALQARRVTKNVERLEAAFASHDSLNQETTTMTTTAAAAVVVREKSRSNQQIYFGSNPTLRLNSSYGSFTNANVTVVNNITARTRSYTQGSKVTDIPSGLY